MFLTTIHKTKTTADLSAGAPQTKGVGTNLCRLRCLNKLKLAYWQYCSWCGGKSMISRPFDQLFSPCVVPLTTTQARSSNRCSHSRLRSKRWAHDYA